MKWTHEIRSYLYERLVREFGPYSDWENNATPKKGKKGRDEYEEWLEDFSKVMKNRFKIDVSPAAIGMQIKWAIPGIKGDRSKSHFKVYIQNTYVALEQGFISFSDLPDKVSFHKNKETKEIPAEEETKNTVVQEVEQDVLDEISAMEIL